MDKSYNVWRNVNGVKMWTGIVRAPNATLANTKAQRLYRSMSVWCEEKDAA